MATWTSPTLDRDTIINKVVVIKALRKTVTGVDATKSALSVNHAANIVDAACGKLGKVTLIETMEARDDYWQSVLDLSIEFCNTHNTI